MRDAGHDESVAGMLAALVRNARRKISRGEETPLEQFNSLVEAADKHVSRGNLKAAAICSFAALRVLNDERQVVEIELSEELPDEDGGGLDYPMRTHLTAFELGIAL